MRIAVTSCLIVLVMISTADAQFRSSRARSSGYNPPARMTSSGTSRPWSQNLISDREHDFGTVARASTQEHIFEFVNNTGEPLTLENVRTSCGCTKPQILTRDVAPGEMAKIKAVFDTYNFYGDRGATVTVSMRKGGTYAEYGELQLAVKGRIRRDVVLSPGEINFQAIPQAQPQQLTATLLYAGKSSWGITGIKSTNPNITAEVQETLRDAASGRVTYQLTVSLNDQQPPGPFQDTLTILTNDPKTTGLPVSVEGTVKSLIDVAPIALGVINQGSEISKSLIVRSSEPIAIDQIVTPNERIRFQPSPGKKKLHILNYTLDTSEPLEIDQPITLITDQPELAQTEVPFSVQVVPATTSSDPNK